MKTTKEILKEIKQSFRLYMNGVTSSSMRQKGADYKINWGVSLSHLHEMAQQYDKDEELATELWKENIRECKILATMLMPLSAMNKEKADEWVNQIHTQEIAELTTFHLFQYIDDATQLALDWLNRESPLVKLCAYHILSSQFKQGNKLSETNERMFLEHASHSLRSNHGGERHAAMNSLNHFADMDEQHEALVQEILG